MRCSSCAVIALSILLPWAAASAETLGDPHVGFTAERVLVFDGHSYIGRMWNMPGEQRHEQILPSLKPVFILRADSSIGDVLLPQLHTAVEFDLPKVLAVLAQPNLLGKPVGRETVNGIVTTKYEVDKEIPDVLEWMMLGSGRLVLHVPHVSKALVLDNVLFISGKEAALKKVMSRLDVRVTTDQEIGETVT